MPPPPPPQDTNDYAAREMVDAIRRREVPFAMNQVDSNIGVIRCPVGIGKPEMIVSLVQLHPALDMDFVPHLSCTTIPECLAGIVSDYLVEDWFRRYAHLEQCLAAATPGESSLRYFYGHLLTLFQRTYASLTFQPSILRDPYSVSHVSLARGSIVVVSSHVVDSWNRAILGGGHAVDKRPKKRHTTEKPDEGEDSGGREGGLETETRPWWPNGDSAGGGTPRPTPSKRGRGGGGGRPRSVSIQTPQDVLNMDYTKVCAADIVLVGASVFNLFAGKSWLARVRWQRVIFDEPPALKIPACHTVDALFYWAMTTGGATCPLGTHRIKHTGFLHSVFGPTSACAWAGLGPITVAAPPAGRRDVEYRPCLYAPAERLVVSMLPATSEVSLRLRNYETHEACTLLRSRHFEQLEQFRSVLSSLRPHAATLAATGTTTAGTWPTVVYVHSPSKSQGRTPSFKDSHDVVGLCHAWKGLLDTPAPPSEIPEQEMIAWSWCVPESLHVWESILLSGGLLELQFCSSLLSRHPDPLSAGGGGGDQARCIDAAISELLVKVWRERVCMRCDTVIRVNEGVAATRCCGLLYCATCRSKVQGCLRCRNVGCPDLIPLFPVLPPPSFTQDTETKTRKRSGGVSVKQRVAEVMARWEDGVGGLDSTQGDTVVASRLVSEKKGRKIPSRLIRRQTANAVLGALAKHYKCMYAKRQAAMVSPASASPLLLPTKASRPTDRLVDRLTETMRLVHQHGRTERVLVVTDDWQSAEVIEDKCEEMGIVAKKLKGAPSVVEKRMQDFRTRKISVLLVADDLSSVTNEFTVSSADVMIVIQHRHEDWEVAIDARLSLRVYALCMPPPSTALVL